MEKKIEPIIVVIDLLKELRAAWVQINKKNKTQTTEQQVPQAMPQQNQENAEKRIRVTGWINSKN